MAILNSIQDLAKKVTGKDVEGENISEVIDDFAKKYEGGGSDPILGNAIETHGMGWTSEEEVEGFDITWDGDTEGLVSVADAFFKVSDLDIANLDVIGSVMTATYDGASEDSEITQEMYEDLEDGFITDDYCNMQSVIIIHNDNVVISDMTFTDKGIYFMKMGASYISRLYKEASTKEVVHQIDQKYIPSGGSGGSPVEFVDITWDGGNNLTASKTVRELVALGDSGKILYARVYYIGEGDIKKPLGTFMATMFGSDASSASIEFGPNRYSPSKDGNYSFVSGRYYSDEDEDEWDIDF